MAPRKSLTLARVFARCTPTESGCLIWQGACNSEGYGHLKVAGKIKLAHRVVAELSGHNIDGLMVLHSCDTKRCCEPTHLSPGTHKENMRQAAERGLTYRGEQNVSAKLTEDAVRSIRQQAKTLSLKVLAELYKVTPWTIANVVQRRSWKHVY